MTRTIELIEEFVSNHKEEESIAYKAVFDEICQILRKAESFVDDYINKREEAAEIKDKKQSMRPIAGNSFSQAIIYIFLQNKKFGNIKPSIHITSEKAKVPSFNTISTIHVDGETQKPDCDLLIYSLKDDISSNNNDTLNDDDDKTRKKKPKKPKKIIDKCIFLSCKTSLRERVGQTYKWKLLMEIATSENSIKEKYNISYNPDEMKMPLTCFATADFYDEIHSPQSRGMFKFFDKSFVAKNTGNDLVLTMSKLPNYINEIFDEVL
jgi:type II restriction enzyme